MGSNPTLSAKYKTASGFARRQSALGLRFCYTGFVGILDFLYPKHCIACKKFGSYVCADCFARLSFAQGNMCLVCNKGTFTGFTHINCRKRNVIDGCFTSLAYNSVAKRLIYAFKYKPYISDLSHTLGEFLYEGIIQQEGFAKVVEQAEHPLLTFVPLHKKRHRERGYNHAEILAKDFAKRHGFVLMPLLIRTTFTRRQVGLKREDRLKNVAGAFRVKGDWGDKSEKGGIRGTTVFIIDDVVTTGATLLECAKVLKQAGVKEVYGITLARE